MSDRPVTRSAEAAPAPPGPASVAPAEPPEGKPETPGNSEKRYQIGVLIGPCSAAESEALMETVADLPEVAALWGCVSCGPWTEEDELSRAALLAVGERDRRQIARLTERLTDAQQLLARLEFVRHGGGATRPMDGESLDNFACPTCGWPKGGHTGPGRIKGNAENTHQEGCSLYAVLHGEPAPRLLKCNDRLARAVLADEEDAGNG